MNTFNRVQNKLLPKYVVNSKNHQVMKVEQLSHDSITAMKTFLSLKHVPLLQHYFNMYLILKELISVYY